MACKVKVSQTNIHSFLCLSIWYLFHFMAQSREETINTTVSVNYLSREIWCRLSAASPLRPATFRTDSFLSSGMYLTRDPRHEETKGCHDLGQPGWVLMCVKPREQVWGQAGGEAIGTMACCHSIWGNNQERGNRGATPGILTAGNIVQRGLGYELGLRLVLPWPMVLPSERWWRATGLLSHFQGGTTASEAKPVNQKSYAVIWKALSHLCIISHLPCEYVML